MQPIGKALLISLAVAAGTVVLAYIINASMNTINKTDSEFNRRNALLIFLTVFILYLILEYTGLHKKFCQANY